MSISSLAGASPVKPRTRTERRLFRELLELGGYLNRAQTLEQLNLVQQYRQMIEERCDVLSGLRR
ncbi:hypothetical protein [Allohahella sp. A8]|jgi:hypothetical protein|uniref:hypothetical protein n=1 Tax=Allohahella sp. A8 TaxID=3141461 RepID=UPI000C097E0A|nr:hypothetical protein [Hahellaceae bacterium]|tara:strand:+ start:25710 stop:25904 length:195 start_codon:yes stop_codon:yes gene_type:complete